MCFLSFKFSIIIYFFNRNYKTINSCKLCFCIKCFIFFIFISSTFSYI